ncbi:hypothetical protein NYR55_03430 [Sphingomonas sp. BGYR3]|uniref:hypothetical protein n=1 Tax=Sphingomonas sp. BGYR3 TaxID=2975483 RepID=UPI0021A4BF65|nr:hypothetical protein [Sphingomonas sp. BGYR3]MDG5487677.1 hypothetical protein [Sphingomonas sp. BGYR3]
MPGQINRFSDLSVVRADGRAEGWIINAGARADLFGPDRSRFWQLLDDGTIRFGDPATRTFYASHKIDLGQSDKLQVFAGERCLWVVPHDATQGDAAVFDLPSASITARIPNLSCRRFALGRVNPDGALILEGFRRIDDGIYNELTLADPALSEVRTSRVACPRSPDAYWSFDFFQASPGGRYWLRLDHTHFPAIDHSATPGAPPRRYYGLTVQIWSAFPLKFERRVVVAWLKAEELPDETHLLGVEALMAVKQQSAADPLAAAPPRPVAPPPTPMARLFGRKGMSGPSADPDQAYRTILAASAPGRDRVYTAASQGLHRPDADPQAPCPGREAFGEAAQDDALWQAVTKNLDALFRETLRNVVGWDGDEAIWFDRLGHLICVGMDGTVSPQLWFERAGLRQMVRPYANLPGKLEVMAGRKLRAVQLPGQVTGPLAEGGCLTVDGAPAERRYEPVRISRYIDGWEGPQSIPAHWFNEAQDRQAVDEYRKTRSTITIPVKTLDPAGRIEAINAYRDLLDSAFFERAVDSSINVRFKVGRKLVPEHAFFSELRPEDRDWAIAPLRELIARYAGLKGRTLDTTYQQNGEHGSLLAQAVLRLGQMDEESLPLLIAYGEGIDGGHEYFFAGETIAAVVAAHGWTDEVIAFVAWAHAFNYYNTFDSPLTIWRRIGLGQALKQRPAQAGAEFIQMQLAPFVADGRLEWTNFAQLHSGLGAAMDDWERAFFDHLIALAGASAFKSN